MNQDGWVAYDFAVLRVVPHVHLGAFVPVGVVVHVRTTEFLDMKVVTNAEELRERIPGCDGELLARYLTSCQAICRGDRSAGPVALLPSSERFHWITAPRSDVIQSSPVHEGLCQDPARETQQLFVTYVGAASVKLT